MDPAPRRLFLVRHGETDWNREGRYQGASDAPLNDAGRAQSRLLAARVAAWDVDAVVTSPLVRAAETASIVGAALGLAPTSHAGLRERDVGAWGGLTRAEIEAAFPGEIRRLAAGEDVAVGGGETMAAAQERISAALADLAALHAGRSVLVVTHGLVRRLLVCRLIGLDLARADRIATGGNTSVTTFEFRGGVPRLAGHCDAAHLSGASAPPL